MLTVVRIIDRDQNRIFCDLKLSISMTNSISYDGPYNGPQYILKISLPGERRHAKFFKQMRSIYPVTISYRKGFEPLICFEDAVLYSINTLEGKNYVEFKITQKEYNIFQESSPTGFEFEED